MGANHGHPLHTVEEQAGMWSLYLRLIGLDKEACKLFLSGLTDVWNSQTLPYKKRLVVFFSLFAFLHGPDDLLAKMDALDAGFVSCHPCFCRRGGNMDLI
mgnify:CR=1 FL=1